MFGAGGRMRRLGRGNAKSEASGTDTAASVVFLHPRIINFKCRAIESSEGAT